MKYLLKTITPAPIFKFRRWIRERRAARMTPAEIFSEVYNEKQWGGAEHDFFSGFGSYLPAEAYLGAIRPVVTGKAVVDLGCGDFNMGRQIAPLCSSYIGCDVVPALVERNRAKFPGIEFRCVDITSDVLPAGDVAIIRQVLQHLTNEQIASFLERADTFDALILTEHLPLGDFRANVDKPQGAGIRLHGSPPSGVVISEYPFNFPYQAKTLLEVPEGSSLLRTSLFSAGSLL